MSNLNHLKVSSFYSAKEYIKNFIFNGNFNLWQRGSSVTSLSSGMYGPDRFSMRKSGSMIYSFSRSSSVPSSVYTPPYNLQQSKSHYSFVTTCTTTQPSIGLTDYASVEYRVEGFDFQYLFNRQITLSFWFKAFTPGQYCLYLKNGNQDLTYIYRFPVYFTNNWEKNSVTLTIPNSGVWNFTNGVGLIVGWTLAAGSNLQIPEQQSNQWVSGDFYSTTTQINAASSTSDFIALSQVQLELGDRATELDFMPITRELLICQRYFEKSLNLETTPADSAGSSGAFSTWTGVNSLTSATFPTYIFQVRKRTSPTMTFYNPSASSSSKIRNVTDSTNYNVGVYDLGEAGFTAYVNGTTDANKSLITHWTAAAEL